MCAFFCAAWAALNLATFCAAVSVVAEGPPEGPGEGEEALAFRGRGCDPGYDDDGENVFEAAERRELGLEYACGEVAVNRVASAADRDIL